MRAVLAAERSMVFNGLRGSVFFGVVAKVADAIDINGVACVGRFSVVAIDAYFH